MKDSKLYHLIKLPMKELIRNNFSIQMDFAALLSIGYIISQENSLLFDQIRRLRGVESQLVKELILIEAKKSPSTSDHLESLLKNGFLYNGVHYRRFGKSAAQGKAGITAFVSDDIFDELFQITQMDIPIDHCVISKYEAQRCLVFSSCTLIENYTPYIVIIDEYTKVLKDQWIRYVVQREKEFEDPESKEMRTYNSREIEEGYYDITLSPFDGCGCHEVEFMNQVSRSLSLDYQSVGAQIRYPFMKGFSVYMPFRQILKEMGVTTITDVYGMSHQIDQIDCIWNITMFKGHGIFKQQYGNKAWTAYMNTIKKYQFKLGISKYSHHTKDISLKTRMNFQYLQCLDLWKQHEADDSRIIPIAEYTTQLFKRIIDGDKCCTYKFLGITDSSSYRSETKYLEAVLANPIMLKDPAVNRYIYRKLKKAINEAKYGKIYVDGFYHTIVGDMIGYLQFAAGKEVIGCLKAHQFYAQTMAAGKTLSFRSPLVCPSEVNEVQLIHNPLTEKWFAHFKDQDIAMINMYDLSMPQQGGMDMDGDAVLLSSDANLINRRISKPLIIDIEDKAMTMAIPYTQENLVTYEVNSRDNRIGEITNVATCILNKYTENTELQKKFDDYISLLRIYQGKEIDYIKTGLRWQMTKGLRNLAKQLPYFLLYSYPKKLKKYEELKKGDYPLNAYHSPSPMNELSHFMVRWEKENFIWKHEFADTAPLLLNKTLDLSDPVLMRKSRRLINEYISALRSLLSDLAESKTDSHEQLFCLNEVFRKKALQITADEELIANYIIKMSYSNIHINKSLAWSVFGDWIITNLKANSPVQTPFAITEASSRDEDAFEFLGKYYQMKERDHDLQSNQPTAI